MENIDANYQKKFSCSLANLFVESYIYPIKLKLGQKIGAFGQVIILKIQYTKPTLKKSGELIKLKEKLGEELSPDFII